MSGINKLIHELNSKFKYINIKEKLGVGGVVESPRYLEIEILFTFIK